MEKLFYQMIFKRKSFHIFTGKNKLEKSELDEIEEVFHMLKPLNNEIKVEMKIVPRAETTCKRGEYCILLFSEKKEHYLQNIGYIGEQMDLWLASKNIGVCWYGMGKTEDLKYKGLDFIIMLAIEKCDEDLFRKDMFKSKRKPLEEIWQGSSLKPISEIVRFAPSACNTQPWIVKNDGKELCVYRYKKCGKRGLMPKDKVSFYNRIDIGIFLLFLEICLNHENIDFKRSLYSDEEGDDEMTLNAVYRLDTNL